MKSTLIDAGPLIALFDKDDKYQNVVKGFIENHITQLITTWAVITEVTHMLDFNVKAQIDFLKWIDSGGVTIFNLEEKHLQRLINLFDKYSNVPMDLADGTLIVASELIGIKRIISIDSDFNIYRTQKGWLIENLLYPYISDLK